MKKILALLALAAVLQSCSRALSPYEAANGKAHCGRYIGK